MRRAERDAQRSSATRARLLEAAFEVLVERGYGGFNTVAVCERANAPRGTMLHHFPSRASLVVASLDHVLGRRVQAFRDAFTEARARAARDGRATDTFSPRAMLDLLWTEFSGPANVAWLELVTAARTDAELRAQLVEVVKRFDANARAAFVALIPAAPGTAGNHDRVLSLLFAALNGLSIDRAYRSDFDAAPVLDALAQVAATLLAEPARTGAPPAPTRGAPTPSSRTPRSTPPTA